MTKEQLRLLVAIVIIIAWIVAVFSRSVVPRGLAASAAIIITWLYMARNGEPHEG